MPPLTDPERLQCYRNALANWRYTDFIIFEDLAWNWLRANLPRVSSQREFARLLYLHVKHNPDEIDEQIETRELWKDLYPFHYDLRVVIGGRRVYFETRLEYKDPSDPDDPVIRVVNAHDV